MLKSDFWCFKTTLCLVLMLCFVIAQSKENSKKEKKNVKMKPGFVRMKPENSKGRQTMEINIDGKTEDMEMEKKKLPVMSKPPSEKNEDVSMYLSQDGTTACMKECKRNTIECKAQCLRQTNNSYTYVSGDKAMDIESDEKLILDLDYNPMSNQRLEALRRQAKPTHRKKREAQMPTLIVPNLNKHKATLKLKLLINTDVMEIFQEFVGGNATEAVTEVEEFFTLAVNTDNTFSSNAPITKNNKDGILLSKTYFDAKGNYLRESGLKIDFAEYMRETYDATTNFNHLQVITGAGARHIRSGPCADEVYVMYPSRNPKNPDHPAASYYSFSVCSAEYFASYLSRFTSGELASCLYTSSPPETEFLSNFCKGFLGSKYGIETYCKIFVDTSSSICPYREMFGAKNMMTSFRMARLLLFGIRFLVHYEYTVYSWALK